MGGDRNPLVSNDNSSAESLYLCEASNGAVVRAECWRSVDSEVLDSGVLQELNDKLLAFGSMKRERLIERLQLQYKVLQENCDLSLEDIRERIRRYKPGDGIQKVGGINRAGFAIPEVTTLLVVGFPGSGKSCLINNMIRVLQSLTDGFDRAQTYVDEGNGSLFLQEYFLFPDANFCVFDGRGFSKTTAFEDLEIIKQWMSNGICHGDAVSRPSDTKAIREALEGRGRQGHSAFTVRRRVDFTIFVVNAFTIHRMRETHDLPALESLTMLYKSPFLSFKDDVPVVVMTHGDQLNPQDRIVTRIFIGELLGVSPIDQVFDISCFTERTVHPGDTDPINDLVLLNMLKFSLERADKNLPYKHQAAMLPAKILGTISDTWGKPGNKIIFLIMMFFWLLYAILMLLCAVKLNQGSQTPGKSILAKMRKKFMHAHYRR